jgi:hypothetical protein
MIQKFMRELDERYKGQPQADINREFGGRVAQVIELAEKVILPATPLRKIPHILSFRRVKPRRLLSL